MDKNRLLRERKAKIEKGSKTVREDVNALVDEGSFVELSAFSFSKDLFYGEDACLDGVVTGFATVGGYPFYIVAQNFDVHFGGLSEANCEKIARTLSAAEKNDTPVIYLLHSYGVQIGEGVTVLEGIAKLLLKATQLKGTVPQYAIVNGEVYGSAAALASLCDAVFFLKNSALCTNSPLVLAAKSGKNLKKEEVGGYAALDNADLPAISVASISEAGKKIAGIQELLSVSVADAELNQAAPALNKAHGAEELMKLLEGGIELGGNSCKEIKTALGRIGGISVAAIFFAPSTALTIRSVEKIRRFAELACCYSVPLVLFVDCVGVAPALDVNNSGILREISEYLNILDAIDTPKISVVTGSAVGLGYSLFAAKSAGFDYTFAFADAKIALFEEAAGAEIEFSGEKNADAASLRLRYAEENSDPVHAAKGGYLDGIIEPQFVKQYLTASLQTLLK